MATMTIVEWAAISEIGGMVVVIISLLLVVSSIRQNTAAMHTANDNFMYERQDAIITTLVVEPSIAELYVKLENKEELSGVDRKRMYNQLFRDLIMWELAFVRLKQGLFSPTQWREWNASYSTQFLSNFPYSWWTEARKLVNDEFAAHVDALYAAAGQ